VSRGSAEDVDEKEAAPGFLGALGLAISEDEAGKLLHKVREHSLHTPRAMSLSSNGELLHKGYTPFNMYETARMRCALMDQGNESVRRDLLEAERKAALKATPEGRALYELKVRHHVPMLCTATARHCSHQHRSSG